MTNLIRVEVDTSELEAKLEDLEVLEAKVEELTNQLANIEVVHTSEALEAKVEELTTIVETLEDHVRETEQQASLEGEDPEGTNVLDKFMTQDEITDLIKEIVNDASISIDA